MITIVLNYDFVIHQISICVYEREVFLFSYLYLIVEVE